MELLNNLFLLPYTLLLITFKYIIAFGLWYLLYNYVTDHWDEWMLIFHGRFTKPKDRAEKPEDYIV
jgi:hypothetical protein